MKPTCRRVLVEEKVPVYEGKIIFPQTYWKKFFYGIVKRSADDCDKSLTEGTFILGEWNGSKKELEKGLWLVEEDSILLIKRETKWHPLGKRVMIIRDNDETITDSGVIITNQLRENTQSLYGTVVSLGYKDNKIIESNVSPGDYIKLRDWDVLHKEIGLHGQYMLSVLERDIICKITKQALPQVESEL